MDKWFKAFGLGLQVLTAIQNVKLGQPAFLTVEWKGKLYTLTMTVAGR